MTGAFISQNVKLCWNHRDVPLESVFRIVFTVLSSYAVCKLKHLYCNEKWNRKKPHRILCTRGSSLFNSQKLLNRVSNNLGLLFLELQVFSQAMLYMHKTIKIIFRIMCIYFYDLVASFALIRWFKSYFV